MSDLPPVIPARDISSFTSSLSNASSSDRRSGCTPFGPTRLPSVSSNMPLNVAAERVPVVFGSRHRSSRPQQLATEPHWQVEAGVNLENGEQLTQLARVQIQGSVEAIEMQWIEATAPLNVSPLSGVVSVSSMASGTAGLCSSAKGAVVARKEMGLPL